MKEEEEEEEEEVSLALLSYVKRMLGEREPFILGIWVLDTKN